MPLPRATGIGLYHYIGPPARAEGTQSTDPVWDAVGGAGLGGALVPQSDHLVHFFVTDFFWRRFFLMPRSWINNALSSGIVVPPISIPKSGQVTA